MSTAFRKLPSTALRQPQDFTISVPHERIIQLHSLLQASTIGPATYESSRESREFGITTAWLEDAREKWINFDWSKVEDELNTFPQYKMSIHDKGTDFDIHFLALFSEKPNAIPLILLHGWPGSFLEFTKVLDILRTKYTPEALPYHVIVPSWPGYAFSSAPPTDENFQCEDVARIFNELMIQLGFSSGYVAQGGDLGSRVARILAVKYPEAKAAHLNYCSMVDPGNIDEARYSATEKAALQGVREFREKGGGYSLMHATRPSTIGLALATSPLALLSWVGEKFLAWTDDDPPLDEILTSVSLYWLTRCFATTIYPYRERFASKVTAGSPEYYIHRPMGYSWFPKDMGSVPRAWIETTGNLAFFREHDRGGHFAALEQPRLFLEDVEDFIAGLHLA
ncbi:related to epoxide hydrolase [Cephalotrichum gorgonifer]|uniref:Related to epoxide hydrolase n=1 Tax=Cephalotrichum gorgonifer TaxID=2041049 RepID=A0AAE8N6E2_9PEZI|nr:related to epoxide hydrolase [Cephalotrichum gorgonifer]